MNATLAGLLLYVALITAVGVAASRRVAGAADFFVAGRTLGPGLLFATLLAANIGAGSTVLAAGLGYRDGTAAWWWVGSAGLGTLALAVWVGPRLWRIAKSHSLLTAGDYLEHRYGPSVRAVAAVLLWLGTLAILAGQLIAMAWILEVVAGAPRWLGAVVGGLVMTGYFAAGGLASSARVNLVQLVVLAAGFLLAAPLAATSAGGLSAVLDGAGGVREFMSRGDSGWTYLLLLAPAFVVSPGILQKTFGARDERAVRLGLAACAVALMLFAFLPVALGMAARSMAPGLDNPETALPVVLTQGVPAWVGLLGLAAVLSAEISSADAILFMLSTSLSRDLYKRFANPAATDAQVLRAARWAAVAGGGAGVLLAVVLPGVQAALTIFYSLLVASLFVPVVAGLFSRRPGSAEALTAVGAGVVGLLGAQVAGWSAPTAWGVALGAAAYGTVFAVRRIRFGDLPPARA